MLVIVGTRSAEHSLRSHVGIGSESNCLLGQLSKILEISDSEAGLKVEKSGGVFGEEGECLCLTLQVGHFIRYYTPSLTRRQHRISRVVTDFIVFSLCL